MQYPIGERPVLRVHEERWGAIHEGEEPGFTETVAREAQQVAADGVGQEKARARAMRCEENYLGLKRDWRHMGSATPESLSLGISTGFSGGQTRGFA